MPTVEAAAKLCAEIDELNRAGEVVALDCRAGLGRTGTLLACQLIWDGATAREGLEFAPSINPYWIQSMEQVNFLAKFAPALRARKKAAAALG